MMFDPENEPADIEHRPDAGFADFAARIAILASAKRYAALMDDLRQRLAAAVEATATVAEQVTERQAKTVAADHERERGELRRRQIATLERKRSLKPRRARLTELHNSWQWFGEDDTSGFRGPEFSALVKARRAYGIAAPAAAPSAEELPGDHWHDGEFPGNATIRRAGA